ncbi:MAG: LPS assembly lipoprotein LptE [Candidatus Korobacteraceae bacterium]
MTTSQIARRTILVGIAVLLLATGGCGYHTGGQAVRLPTDLHTLYVPTFINATSIYRIEQTITEDVIREFHDRTHYRIVTTNADGAADATLNGTVTAATISPMTYDPATGRISSGMVSVSMKVSLVTSKGKVLWANPNYSYREQYQVSRDAPSFLEEEEPALGRIASSFAKTLVSDILEAY